MNATFDLQSLFPDESFDFLGVKIPKYGSLTPNEQKAIEADENVLMLSYKCAVVKIILLSRCENIPEDVDTGKAPIHVINAAYDFVVNEIHEWKPQANEEDSEKKAPTGQDSTTDLDSTTLTPNSGTAQPISSESP